MKFESWRLNWKSIQNLETKIPIFLHFYILVNMWSKRNRTLYCVIYSIKGDLLLQNRLGFCSWERMILLCHFSEGCSLKERVGRRLLSNSIWSLEKRYLKLGWFVHLFLTPYEIIFSTQSNYIYFLIRFKFRSFIFKRG